MTVLESQAWFGPYRLSSRIGTGGMGEVYLGRRLSEQDQFGPPVAIKRLFPHLAREPAIVRMFLNEAHITAQIDHPNVVKVLERGYVGDEPFIAMELLEGRSFAETRQQAAQMGRPVPLGITLRVLAEACRGLDAAHRVTDEQGRPVCIVHRDFSPENIHVGVAGDVKVIDFGIARTENLGSGTEPGILKGKFFYMSPEMIAGRKVDHRADLYAAGVMLYEQLCGRHPFTGLDPEQVLHRISEGKPCPPTQFDPSVPPALEAICLKALDKEPERRFASLEEFITAIEAVGGPAELASREEVGKYISYLFPAEHDPKRQTLRLAIEANPSFPGAPAPQPILLGQAPGTALAPETRLAETPGMEDTAVRGAASAAPVAESTVPRWLLAVMAGGVLLVTAVLAARSWFHPPLSPAARLAAAEATPEVAARGTLLEPLGDDPAVTADQLAHAGELLIASSASNEALALAESFAQRFPQDAAAALLEARAAIQLRLGKRAEAAAERARTLAPEDPTPDLLLAELRQAQGDLPGAIEVLSLALKRHPKSTELLFRQGMLLSQAERLDEAAKALSTLIERRFNVAAAAEMGFIRFRQNRLVEARKWLGRALKKDPRLFEGHYYLGAVLFRQGHTKGAERAYRKAATLAAPGDARALLALCEVQLHGGDTKGAQKTRELLTGRFPEQAAELGARCKP